MSLTQEEVYAKGDRIVELEQALRLHITLWTGGLFPTETLIEEIDEMLGIVEQVKPHAKGDTSPLDAHVRKWKRKRAKYAKYLQED